MFDEIYSISDFVRETQRASFITSSQEKLMNARTQEDLVRVMNALLDSDEVKHKELGYLIELVKNKWPKNHQDRALLLQEIFTHPKSISHPDLFCEFFNIYANEPEKIFEILKENFPKFIHSMMDNRSKPEIIKAVRELSERIDEQSKTSYRKALTDGEKNIPLEVYCIVLAFPDLFRPIEWQIRTTYNEDGYPVSDERVRDYQCQQEFNWFGVTIRTKLLDALQTRNNNDIPGDVLIALSEDDNNIYHEALKKLAKEKLDANKISILWSFKCGPNKSETVPKDIVVEFLDLKRHKTSKP